MWSKAAKGNLPTMKGRPRLMLRAQGQLVSVLEEQSTAFARLSFSDPSFDDSTGT